MIAKSSLNIHTTAQAIFDMRTDVRSKHRDVRQNNVVMQTLWDFVNGLEGHVNISESTNGKRKRPRKSGEDADEDFRAPPIMTLGPKPTTRSKHPKK